MELRIDSCAEAPPDWTCSPDVAEVWETPGIHSSELKLRRQRVKGTSPLVYLRQLSFIFICLSVLGSCYCSATDLIHVVAILTIWSVTLLRIHIVIYILCFRPVNIN